MPPKKKTTKTPKPRKPNDLFATLDAINLKRPIKYDKKEASGYMLALWLSHAPELLPLLNKLNPLIFELPDEMIFKYLMAAVPKRSRFLKWTKGVKDSKVEEAIKELMEEYGISRREAIYSI